MKPSKNIIYILLLTLALFGTGLSCGVGGGGAQVTLTIWKPFDSSDKWQPIISAYTQSQRGVQINYVQKPIETYERDLLEAMAAGQGPDIFAIRNDWLPRYQNKISPAPEALVGLRYFQDTFANVASKDLVAEGKIYALPSSIDVLSLFYNRQLLASAGIARPPDTWPEFVSLIPSLTKFTGNGQITQAGVALGTSNNVSEAADILQLLMLQSGVQFYGPNFNNVTITQGQPDENGQIPAARALRFYTQFADPTSQVYSWNARQDFSTDAFAQGRVAMVFGYSYLISDLASREAFLDYGISAMPQLTNTGPKVNLASYWAEAVWVGSRNPDAAWHFLRFATDYAQNKSYVEATKQPSSRKDVLAEQQRDPILGVFADNVLSAQSVAKPEAVQFEKILTDLIDDVTLLGMTTNDAIRKAGDQMRLLADRYRGQN